MNTLTPADLVLSTQHVTKTFGKTVALDDITLNIPAGRVIGLLGRNGAGKTTLLDILSGLVLPTSGECRTLGCRSDNLEARQLQKLGLVMQEGRFVEWMTVRQHLDFTASFYDSWDRGLGGTAGLGTRGAAEPKDRGPQSGRGQKISILLGVCHRPSLLLLDEPMSSLDPIARMRMRNLSIERLREDGCTIVISSHLLTDVEKIVDRIVAVEGGRVLWSRVFSSES